MKAVYLMYRHKLAAGNGKEYAKIAQTESFKWLGGHIESGLIKEVKVLSPIFGSDEFILYLKFDSLEDASIYTKSFEDSGIKAKYMNLMSVSETVVYEEHDEEQTKRFFETLENM